MLRQRLIAIVLNLAAVGLLAAHLLARTQPASAGALPTANEAESAWWGLWFMTRLPDWVTLFGATAVSAAALAGIVFALMPFVATPALPEPAPERGEGWLPIVAVALLAFFFLFPIIHTRWGDAYLLATAIAIDDRSLQLTHSWQAPLDVFLHSQIWLNFGHLLGNLPLQPADLPEGAPVYRLLSPLAGALLLLGALGFSLNRRLGAAWIPFLLFASLGTVQLFFGYIENYSYAAAGVMLYLWLGIRVLHGRSPLWLAATALALTNATHPSTIVLAPSLLVLGWLLWRQRNQLASADVYGETQSADLRRMAKEPAGIVLLRLAAQILLPMLIVGAGVFLWMEWSGHGMQALLETDRPGGSDARWLVPLYATSTRWEHYTMFSWAHLRDFANEQALIAPALWPALALTWLGGLGIHKFWRGEGKYLLAAVVFYLLFVWLWNPDYGGQRDWDLFSLSALPLAGLTAWVATRFFTQRRLLWAGLGALVLLQILHTAGWVWFNTLPWHWPN